MEMKIAFALNSENLFEKKHFGDADKYNIYHLKDNSCKLISEEQNIFKEFDEDHSHGSRKKGEAITKFLKDQGATVLVSRQFGANIKIIARHFVPVIIYEESTEEVCNILLKHVKWLYEETQVQSENFKLFIINNGILKTAVDKK